MFCAYVETVPFSLELCGGVHLVRHNPRDGLKQSGGHFVAIVSQVAGSPFPRSRSTLPSCGGACRTHPWWRRSSPARTSSWPMVSSLLSVKNTCNLYSMDQWNGTKVTLSVTLFLKNTRDALSNKHSGTLRYVTSCAVSANVAPVFSVFENKRSMSKCFKTFICEQNCVWHHGRSCWLLTTHWTPAL